MKRKVKRYDVGGMTDEEGKKGIFGPKADKEEEDPRGTYFKSPRSTPRSSLPSFKEKTGTSYGPGSDSDSPAASVRKTKSFSNKSKSSDFSSPAYAKAMQDIYAKPSSSEKKSSFPGVGTAAAVLAGLGGLGLAGMKSNMKNSKDARSSLRKGIKAIDPSQPDYLDEARFADEGNPNYKRGGKVKAKMSYGGKVKKMASGGKSASARADGCAIRGKTRA